MKLRKPDSKIFILLFLGTLSAFGPFVMDMYLPTLPEMTDYFSTTSSAVQLGLTTSMIGDHRQKYVFRYKTLTL